MRPVSCLPLLNTERTIACAYGSRTRSPSSQPSSERGIVVEGSEIVECVARGQSPTIPPDTTFNASRHVVLPGLINAHHHFYQTLTRAHPAGFGKELIPWLVSMERVWDRMTPEALHLAIRMALVELMVSGCTTAADHHNLFPPNLTNAIDIEVEEATKLGIRMTVTRGSMGISEKDGGLQPDSIVQDSETILEDSERVLRLYHDDKPGAMIRVALAPCSPLAVPKRVMVGSAELAERYDCRLHTHLCQSLDEDVYAVETFGVRSVDLLEQAGWLSPRAWVAHGIHFNAGEIERFGSAGVSVCHCAASDMAFGMGVCPTKELEAAGVDDRAWRRRLGLEQFVEHDGGRAPFADAAAPELRALGGDPLRRAPLGDARLGALPRTRRHRRHCARAAGRPRALHARRAALLGRPGPDRRARPLRRPSGGPGHGRGDMAGHRRET